VPQGRHAHALLSSGRRALESFFPGFVDEIGSDGALAVDIKGLRWFDNGGYHARCTGISALLASRALLEKHVRTRVRALPNVRLRGECNADSVLFSDDRRRVTGVRAHSVGGGSNETIEADLVVDAAGRGSQLAAWLDAAGIAKPVEESVRVGLGYSTRIFRRRPDHLDGDFAMITPAAPPARRGGAMLAMEGDRWMVTLFGVLGDHPPSDEAGFLDFAQTLPAKDIYETIRNADALSDPLPFKFPASTRRRYEHLASFPEGLLAFGDSICSFNPIYGQGMSAAALQAGALKKCLEGGTADLPKRFFTAAAAVVDNPWTMAMGGDLRYPEVEGPRSRFGDFINWYLGKLHVAARTDASVSLAFHSVANLLKDPPSLLHPRVALRVVKGNIGAR
jgi:2-polyprenyl-6-methoxyphenol hydroxylase-like FAD-dependent oxidoreductase